MVLDGRYYGELPPKRRPTVQRLHDRLRAEYDSACGQDRGHEDVEPLMEQMLGKSEIGGIATGVSQHPIQFYFQPSGRGK